jgi:hypothetical protein
MATVSAVHDVASAIVATLRSSYGALTEKPVEDCSFKVAGSGELSKAQPEFLAQSKTTLSLFLYRITLNEHVRQAAHLPSRTLAQSPLSIDLHFLLTAWAASALEEQTILTWAMQQIHARPLLAMESLAAEGWQAEETVQVLPTDLAMEDLMRLWDGLEPSYRLSVAYVARVVRVDPADPTEAPRPVLATRFGYGPVADGTGDWP